MSDSSQFALLTQRRFAPFFATQFLGAFNDNVFRNGLVILLTFTGTRIAGMDVSQLAFVAGALFILPFFLFSATAGQLADKYEKSRLFRAIKLMEIVLMIVAAFAFITGRYPLLMLVLFLMGSQSAMFGPVKYAYLPQQLETDELVGGNALVESGTYVAIILGLMVGGLSISVDSASQVVLAALLVTISLLGYLASRRIPVTKAVDPELKINWNVITETWRIVGYAREKRSVFLPILGISWFWFYGSVITLQIPAYTLVILHGNETITTLLLVAFALGVGMGSLLCERMSGHRIELGLVPFGSIGLSLFAIDLYFSHPLVSPVDISTLGEFVSQAGGWRILIDLTLIGAFGGFYSVPLYAMVQERANRQHLSRTIAANNILNAFFMVTASIMAITLLYLGLSIPQLFLVLAVLNAIVATYIFSLLPEFLVRFLAWIFVSLLYRIRTTGIENIPHRGPAVLVCNHVSFVDALVLGGCVHRPVRFVMYYKIFQIPILNFIFKTAKTIPIASARENASMLQQSFDKIDEELQAGNIVCIFPEGAITTDGDVHAFRPGIEKIIERNAVPVIPVALCGLWGSWFSRQTGGGVRKIPGKLFSRIEVRIGDAVRPADVTAGKLELLVRTLRGATR
ncbi:MAG: MFS transporter [Gammaproteobacteria bacterium]|nr:MFS transporter [Gammaproteobacteria bacterium]